MLSSDQEVDAESMRATGGRATEESVSRSQIRVSNVGNLGSKRNQSENQSILNFFEAMIMATPGVARDQGRESVELPRHTLPTAFAPSLRPNVASSLHAAENELTHRLQEKVATSASSLQRAQRDARYLQSTPPTNA